MPNKTFWRPHTRACFIFYLFCSLLLLFSSLFLILSLPIGFSCGLDVVAMPLQQFRVSAISSLLFDPSAIQKVTTSIGVTAIALTWLINANQQQVYGIKIGTLLRWAYPGFFRYYFSVFLFLYIICIHTSSVSSAKSNFYIWLAMLSSYIGVLISTIYFLYIAYTFVLNFERRQDIALSYHYHHIEWIEGRYQMNQIANPFLLDLKLIKDGLLKNNHPNYNRGFGTDTTACLQGINEGISILGKSIGQRMIAGEAIDVASLYSIWSSASAYYTKSYIGSSKSDVLEIYSLCFLAERFWSLALPNNMVISEQTQLARMLIRDNFPLYNSNYIISVTPPLDWVRVYPTDCFVVGFLLSFNFESLSDGRLQQIIPALVSMNIESGGTHEQLDTRKFVQSALVIGYLVMCFTVKASASQTFKNFLVKSDFVNSGTKSISIPTEQKKRFVDFMMTLHNAYIMEKGCKNKWDTHSSGNDYNELFDVFMHMAQDALEERYL